MSLVIQEHLRARLVTDGPEPRLVPVRLSCDTAAPQTVRVHIPGAAELTLGRDVLESGLRSPVTSGGLRLWPCGRAQLVVERHTPDGVAVFQFDNAPLLRFLRRTYETHDTDATPRPPRPPSRTRPAPRPGPPPARPDPAHRAPGRTTGPRLRAYGHADGPVPRARGHRPLRPSRPHR